MAVPIAIPKLGLTMTDCTLLGWSKADGDRVSKGDILYTIETDKIASEVEAEASGVLRRVAEVDAQLTVGAVIGYLHEAAEQAAGGPDAGSDIGPPAMILEPAEPDGGRRRIRVSPVARRIAAAAGIDPAGLTGTGPGGAILRRDVERAVAERRAEAPAPAPATPPDAVPPPPAVLPPAAEPVPPDGAPQRRPLAGMRRAIATRMMQSLQGSAQMTAFGRIDMAEAVRFRSQCLEAERDLGVRITYTDLMLKAAATVLTEMPQINASLVGDEIVTWGAVDIGLAVALDDGLIVPVIRDAGQLTLPEIARARLDLIARARSGRLSREETEGGTFTLSNFGSYGGDFETPILNPPQSALLGIGRIADEPAVRDGQIVIRPMMSISMTFDHRLIDGAVAGRFRARLRDLLERPALWLAALR